MQIPATLNIHAARFMHRNDQAAREYAAKIFPHGVKLIDGP